MGPCAASAARQVGVLDAKLRAAAAALAPALDAAADAESSDPLDPLALRLLANGVSLLGFQGVAVVVLLHEGVKPVCSRVDVHSDRRRWGRAVCWVARCQRGSSGTFPQRPAAC